MIAIISPAKTLDYDTPLPTKACTQPAFLNQSQQLVDQLKALAPKEIAALMHVSMRIAALNFERFQSWQQPFDCHNARPAIFAFKGDVYSGLDAYSLSNKNINYAQQHLRIISGLYGLLKPLDLMQPYRLEMGTKLENQRGRNLYEFWGERITDAINRQLKNLRTDTLVNLASNEYFKAIHPKNINGRIVTPVFKEKKSGEFRVVGIFAKKARGVMARYMIDNQISQAEDLQAFDRNGYRYNPKLSDEHSWVFSRKQNGFARQCA